MEDYENKIKKEISDQKTITQQKADIARAEAKENFDDEKVILNKFIKNKLKRASSKDEKDVLMKAYKEEKRANTRFKLTETEELQTEKSAFYVQTEPAEDRSQLWDKNEQYDLEDLTINLMADDEKSLLKGRRQMKWDAKKKKYVEMIVGMDGKTKAIRNESGAFINDKKKKKPELYKKWMKRTHLRVQSAGEVEDEKGHVSAASSLRERREMKRMGSQGKDVKGIKEAE